MPAFIHKVGTPVTLKIKKAKPQRSRELAIIFGQVNIKTKGCLAGEHNLEPIDLDPAHGAKSVSVCTKCKKIFDCYLPLK